MKKKMVWFFVMVMAFAVSTSAYAAGYRVTDDLWIRAVINTVDGPIDAVLYKGGEKMTERGDTVIWGYFYVDPDILGILHDWGYDTPDVSWGSKDNPDLYVKIWFDVTGRIDVNFFHVSVPTIDIYTEYPYNGSYDKHGTATMDNRYIRHEYWRQNSTTESCENIDGNWNISGTLSMIDKINGEIKMTDSDSFSESLSIEQTDCNVKVVGNTILQTGNVEGNIVYLSGTYLTNSEVSAFIQAGLNQAGVYGATVTVTTNTGNGKGTISGNIISYKGSGTTTGKVTYLGTSIDFSMEASEDSKLTRTSLSRSRTPDEESGTALSPKDLMVDLLVKAIKQKLGQPIK